MTFDQHAVAELEAALALDSESLELRERLLELYASATEPEPVQRRMGHIRWFISRHPENFLCRTPFLHFDHEAHPEDYSACLALWREATASQPGSSDIVQGLALFLSLSDREGAVGVLETALKASPNDAGLWLELGRLSREPGQRLIAFSRARDNGSNHPNLRVWEAKAAVDAGEQELAVKLGEELLAQVRVLREEFGEKLDWVERGRALWERAAAEVGDKVNARALTRAIADAAYLKHWAHTVLGLASCAKAEIDRAEDHLLLSGRVTPDHRLGAYGPSLDLVHALCLRERRDVPLRFLRDWRSVAPNDEVALWIEKLEKGELPEG